MGNENLIVPPFTAKYLEGEKPIRDIVSVSLNAEERSILEWFKALVKIPHDSKAIKFLMEIGVNVVKSDFSEKQLKYLCSNDRSKLSD